jgi:flagellar hook-length control protein FliK
MAGETAKASVPALVQSNANNNNAPTVSAVAAVSAASAVQPVTSQAVTQAGNSSETSSNLNTAGNSAKDTLADTANLQSLAAAMNAGIATTDKSGNTFQNTVNTVANSNPNGSIDSAQIMNQITQQVASQTADAKMVSRLSFQLVPESLGRVTIQVALVDQSISARIMVSNPDVREVLQQHMVDLKAALSQAGLQIDQMQVQVQGGGSNLLAQYYQYQQEGNSYRESAWSSANTSDQPQNVDNSAVLVAAGSSLNFLV